MVAAAPAQVLPSFGMLAERLNASRSELNTGVTALLDGIEEPEKRIVHFKCHHEASRNVFEPVIDSLAKAGALIAVVGEEGEPSTVATE